MASLFCCDTSVILPFPSVLWTSSRPALDIKPTASPQDKIFSLLNIQLHFIGFGITAQLVPRSSTTCFRHLLSKFGLRVHRALVGGKVFSGPLCFGWESEQVPDCILPEKAEVSGSRFPPVFQYDNSPAPAPAPPPQSCSLPYPCSVGYTRKASHTIIKTILCRSCAPLLR